VASLIQRLNWARLAETRRGVKKRGEFRADVKVLIPADVLVKRDRLLRLKPISISQALFGDPLPGRSALELGPDARPAIVSDPLDALIYRH
jgi:hypothetical protein